MSDAALFNHPGSDGRSCPGLQPSEPLSGTGQLAADSTPEAFTIPYDGVLLISGPGSSSRMKISNDPTDLANANSMLLPNSFNAVREIPVRAGQTFSLFQTAGTSMFQVWMAARNQDVNDFT